MRRGVRLISGGALCHEAVVVVGACGGGALDRAHEPPTGSLAAFEPSLHFVDVVHALDIDAPGRGGNFVIEGAEADADVDSRFDGSLNDLRAHVVLL